MTPRNEWMAQLLILLLTCGVLAHCAGAGLPTKATAYALELAACREDAGRYDDYELCALAVDSKYGKRK